MSNDVIIVGAGLAGIYALYSLRSLGLKVKIYESAPEAGGVWYHNRYPGARCDIESLEFSYSFSKELEQQWHWPHRYATQSEVLSYINHVIDRFDLEKDIIYNRTISSAKYKDGLWYVDGEATKFLILATGSISVPKYIDIPNYKGEIYHTAKWPHHTVDFADKSVAVIGTGASAVQIIPEIAKTAKQLTVYQRTANYSILSKNSVTDPNYESEVKSRYETIRKQQKESIAGIVLGPDPQTQLGESLNEQQRRDDFEQRWTAGGLHFYSSFLDIFSSQSVNDSVSMFLKNKIRSIVSDPATADKLCPDYPFGAKRFCVDEGYYETFNKKNVSLSIGSIENPDQYDQIILATGFENRNHAMTKIEIINDQGVSLNDKIQDKKIWMGLMKQGFPNLFFIDGPSTPPMNTITSIEYHVNWITQRLSQNITTIEPTAEAESRWRVRLDSIIKKSLLNEDNSKIIKDNIVVPYLGGFKNYREICEKETTNQNTFSIS